MKLFKDEKTGAALYAFVCYKTPDSASVAKQTLPNVLLNGKNLNMNFYEIKEVRQLGQEKVKDD